MTARPTGEEGKRKKAYLLLIKTGLDDGKTISQAGLAGRRLQKTPSQ
jgi:hypothetical protein